MSIEFIFYILLPIFSFFICSILAVWLNRHYKSVGSKEITIILILSALWSILSVFQLINAFEQSLLWLKLSYIPISLLPVYWLLFATNYSHQKKILGNTSKAFLLIFPIITTIFIWIPNLEKLMWTSYSFEIHNTIHFFVSEKGFWFWTYIGYLYSLLLLGTSIILIRLNLYENIFKKQTIGIIVSFFIPFIANIIYDAAIFPNMLGDITPSLLGFSGIIILFSMNVHRLFDILPEPPTAIFHHSRDGIIVLDAQYRIVSANEAFTTLINVDLKPFIGKYIHDAFPDWQERLSNLLAGELPENMYWFNFNNIVLEARVAPYHDKSKSGYLVYIRDVTQIAQAREEILLSQKKYKSLYENMLTGAIVFSTNDDGNTFLVSSANKYAELKFDLPEEDIVGKSFDEVYEPQAFQQLKEAIKSVWQTQESLNLPVLKFIQDGRPEWREFNIYSLSNNDVIVICKDITEEKLAKEKLTRMNEDLEAYVDQLENFSSEVLLLNRFGNNLLSCKTYQDVATSLSDLSQKLLQHHLLRLIILDTKELMTVFSNVMNTDLFFRVF